MVVFAIAAVGHLRGGLAIASILACMLFPGRVGLQPRHSGGHGLFDRDRRHGAKWLTKEFAAGVICNAGTLGILIPPSIVMVVYAARTEVSVGRTFMAGVIPGILLGLMR
jgi:C4-dicarboxylate transporter DctM subunit